MGRIVEYMHQREEGEGRSKKGGARREEEEGRRGVKGGREL